MTPSTIVQSRKSTGPSFERDKGSTIDMTSTRVHSILVDGMNVFYREAGRPGRPVILLLHGSIASSFQFRQLMPILAREFHVFAPDLPGHGFTTPSSYRLEPYKYTFANLAKTITAFVNGLNLTSYALYLFDFGAAVGWRLALAHPERVTAVIAQSGNAYAEGLGKAWEPIRALWEDVESVKASAKHEYTYRKVSEKDRDQPSLRLSITTKLQEGYDGVVTGSMQEKLRLLRAAFLTPEGVHWLYSHGTGSHGNGRTVSPESHILESSLLLQEPERGDIYLGLLADYRTTVRMYPLIQRYLREWAPRVLAIWGSRDAFLSPVGAKMYRRDVPDAEILVLDAGHYVLETHVEEVAAAVTKFVLMW